MIVVNFEDKRKDQIVFALPHTPVKTKLSLIYPEKLLYDSAWLAGFLDAEGTVTINQFYYSILF